MKVKRGYEIGESRGAGENRGGDSVQMLASYNDTYT